MQMSYTNSDKSVTVKASTLRETVMSDQNLNHTAERVLSAASNLLPTAAAVRLGRALAQQATDPGTLQHVHETLDKAGKQLREHPETLLGATGGAVGMVVGQAVGTLASPSTPRADRAPRCGRDISLP